MKANLPTPMHIRFHPLGEKSDESVCYVTKIWFQSPRNHRAQGKIIPLHFLSKDL